MKKQPRVELTDRDRLLLTQAHTDLLTVESAHHHYFVGQDIDAVRSNLRRLYGNPPRYLLLRPYPLDRRRKYYRLTRRGARLRGASKHHTRPLNQLGKVERYALSWLMHIDSRGERTHLDPQDHPDKFFLLEHRFPRLPFYLEEKEGAVRLGCVLVDHNASHQNAARKTIRALERFLLHGWFDAFIGAGLFDIQLLTFDERRRCSLQRLLTFLTREKLKTPLTALGSATGQPHPLNIQVRHVPGMKQLLLLDRDPITNPRAQ